MMWLMIRSEGFLVCVNRWTSEVRSRSSMSACSAATCEEYLKSEKKAELKSPHPQDVFADAFLVLLPLPSAAVTHHIYLG